MLLCLVPLVSLATIFIQQSLRIGIAIILKLRHKSAQSYPLTTRGIGKQYEMTVPDLSILPPVWPRHKRGLSHFTKRYNHVKQTG